LPLLLPLFFVVILTLSVAEWGKDPCICLCLSLTHPATNQRVPLSFALFAKGGMSYSPNPKATSAEGLPLYESTPGEAADLIAFAVVFKLFFAFLTQKSHVKSQNHLTNSTPTTSIWHFSYTQPAIIKLEIKKAPGQNRGFPL
jgi:hypothetical protein